MQVTSLTREQRIRSARSNHRNPQFAGKHAKGRCHYEGQKTQGGAFGGVARRNHHLPALLGR